MRKFIVSDELAGLHVVKAATKVFPGLKTPNLYRALKRKDIRIDGKKVSSDLPVKEGAVVEVWLPDSLFEGSGDIIPEKKKDPDYKIVAQTDGILIVNKRQGLAVHSGKSTGSDNLIDIVRNSTGNPNMELVHRIDMNTGGLVMLAKNKSALEDAIRLFRENLLIKRYRCLVLGVPTEGETVICEDDVIMKEVMAYLEKTSSGSVFVHDYPKQGDLEIITRYRVLEVYRGAGPDGIDVAELECELVTGRTHQIRAQFAHMGYPIIGDGNYGRNKSNLFFRSREGGKVKNQQLFATTLLMRNIPSDNMHRELSGRKFSIEPRYEIKVEDLKRKKQHG